MYASIGVREYWIIHDGTRDLLVYSLKNGKYVPTPLFISRNVVESNVIEGLTLDLEGFFGVIE
ncbi:Uma2 family endonuclease [Cyclobacterium plantarum]|uniref:Uma2 family endonuclease n=1 Tax=Cyclobacterium plantarum TaxID=2716263 RepID=UPI00293BF634|nr:Uma2 family endonuclease [Cyclobacterium plantarum]